MKASYLKIHEQGELQKRIRRARELLSPCRLCPRHCGVNRLQTGKLGICGTGERAMVASYGPHFGEESPLVGTGGSGTIFFSHCNLGCVFCQNWDISHKGAGTDIEIEDLADMMLQLCTRSVSNINILY